ncbi:MAG: triose-phosphate isomerase [Candidatus Nealsonbacteria bacterium]|nr:triose-phosphate isomerase [Candidatus Nealsonbacteria bacterium]
MKKIFIVANWKLNPIAEKKAGVLFSTIQESVREEIEDLGEAEVVICPPFLYLPVLKKEQKREPEEQRIELGSQDCFWEDKGAFTGEVSPLMLRDMGCKYVIVGHSERRKFFSENDEMVNKKIKAALKHGLRPIVCIDKLDQAEAALQGIDEEQKKKVIVAYELLWAIGSGKPCSYEQAREFNLSLKEVIGSDHPTLYGGSVNAENAVGFISESQFQGLLIGGASLRPDEFFEIIRSVRER